MYAFNIFVFLFFVFFFFKLIYLFLFLYHSCIVSVLSASILLSHTCLAYMRWRVCSLRVFILNHNSSIHWCDSDIMKTTKYTAILSSCDFFPCWFQKTRNRTWLRERSWRRHETYVLARFRHKAGQGFGPRAAPATAPSRGCALSTDTG